MELKLQSTITALLVVVQCGSEVSQQINPTSTIYENINSNYAILTHIMEPDVKIYNPV